MRPLVTGEFCLHPAVQEIRMQEVPSSHLPVITGICNPCKSPEWRHCSLKLELKLKYLKEAYYDFIKTKVGLGFLNVQFKANGDKYKNFIILSIPYYNSALLHTIDK